MIGNIDTGVQTKSATEIECLYHNFLNKEEAKKKVDNALKDTNWVATVQKSLNEFKEMKSEN